MKTRLNVVSEELPVALVFLGLLILSIFIVPRESLVAAFALGALVVLSAFWAAAVALRGRWREAKTTAAFASYWVWLIAVALVISLGWVLVICIVEDFVRR